MVIKHLTNGTGGNLGAAGGGNDTVYVDDSSDFIDAAGIITLAGRDTINLTKPAASGQHDVWSGSGNDTINGGIGFEIVADGSGSDTIKLGANDDIWDVGKGNDTADGGKGFDLISFLYVNNDAGVADVFNTVAVKLDLGKTTVQNFGIYGMDKITGFEDAEGGNGADTLLGSAGNNYIWGDGGNDQISGRGGKDFLFGEAGKDTLNGGKGADTLDLGETGISTTGNVALRDIAKYTSIADSGTTSTTRDTIVNFDGGGLFTDDRIDLSAIDAKPVTAKNDSFLFRGAGAFSSTDGEVRLTVSGADTIVHVDTDADAQDEMTILVKGVIGLTQADFVL